MNFLQIQKSILYVNYFVNFLLHNAIKFNNLRLVVY